MSVGADDRLYTPQDAPLLLEDLTGAKELFHSGGDGLPANQIDDVCEVCAMCARCALLVSWPNPILSNGTPA